MTDRILLGRVNPNTVGVDPPVCLCMHAFANHCPDAYDAAIGLFRMIHVGQAFQPDAPR